MLHSDIPLLTVDRSDEGLPFDFPHFVVALVESSESRGWTTDEVVPDGPLP